MLPVINKRTLTFDSSVLVFIKWFMIKKMKITLTAPTVAKTMFAGNASAFDPDHLQELRDTGSCFNCNLSHADLCHADLMHARLAMADLRDAELIFANMMGAILCNTTMPDGSVIYSGC